MLYAIINVVSQVFVHYFLRNLSFFLYKKQSLFYFALYVYVSERFELLNIYIQVHDVIMCHYVQ